MSRRHLAIFSMLTAGHLYPTLGMCCELVRRGYRITYPTIERFADKIRQTGAEPLIFKLPVWQDAEKVLQYPAPEDPTFWAYYASIFAPDFLMAAAATVTALEGFYYENAPDAVVYDQFSFAGRIFAKRSGCPGIQHWAHFANHDFMIRQDGIGCNPDPMPAFYQILDAFMSTYGVDGRDNLWHKEKLNIYFFPREFQFDADSFDDRFCFVGPCLERPPQASWKNNAGGRPILLVNESSATLNDGFRKICFEAFADSKYHVVFSVGENSPPFSGEVLPSNFEINRDAYNIEIFPHASLTICQAGMGTTMESLSFGVPILAAALPSPWNCEVAYRIAELGLGLDLPVHSLSAKAMREGAEKILQDPTVESRVKLMQQAIKNSGGARLAADRIESILNK